MDLGLITVDVCVVAEISPDFVSRQIMKRIGAPYSHAMIIYKDKVYHAIGEGVCIQSIEDGLHASKIMGAKQVQLKCSEESFFAFMAGADGKGYSVKQLAGFFSNELAERVANGRAELICSEFVAWVVEYFDGFQWDEELDFVDPREMFEPIP